MRFPTSDQLPEFGGWIQQNVPLNPSAESVRRIQETDQKQENV